MPNTLCRLRESICEMAEHVRSAKNEKGGQVQWHLQYYVGEGAATQRDAERKPTKESGSEGSPCETLAFQDHLTPLVFS